MSKAKDLQRRLITALTVSLTLMVSAPQLAAEQPSNDDSQKSQRKQELEKLQQDIAARKNQLKQQLAQINDTQQQLKQQEVAIGNLANSLLKNQAQLSQVQYEQVQLSAQQLSKRNEAEIQQRALSEQLVSAYMTGKHDYIKLLLNQEQAASLERVLVYYQYLNAARIQKLETLKTLMAELSVIEQKLTERNQQLTILLNEQQEQQRNLEKAQAQRKVTLAKLNKEYDNDELRVQAMQQEFEALRKALESIRQLTGTPIELAGLTEVKGKLPWPHRGSLRHRYGQIKAADMRWKGVVLRGNAGDRVQTVYQGQVVFADWVKGFGLVIAIDHGDGFMSIYGHNQSLLKQVGEKVEAGEPIALVGQSGGQAEAGLYFEIRHKGQALNPEQWCRAS